MKTKLLLLLLLSSALFGAEYTVYAWGYGDILGETLQMIALLFHYSEYEGAWKIMMALALFASAMASVVPGSDIWKTPKVFLISTGVWSMFVVAQVTIKVEDLTNTSNNQTITSVPWAVGYPMSLISTLDYKLGQSYELASSMPASLRYTDGGMMLPLNLFNASTSFKITDTKLSQNVYNYTVECVIPDFEDGTKDYDFAMQSDDLWAYMGGTNAATLTQYLNTDGTKSTKSCADAYSSINSDMSTYFSASGGAMQNLATQMGFGSAAAISSKLGTTHQWLHQATGNASSILMQNASINAFNSTFKSYAMMNGADPQSAAMYAGKAESVASSNMLVSGILGSKYIPITKGILIAIVAGLTPMLALVMLTPLAMKSFIGYLTMLLWLATWHLGEVILNHLISVKARGVIDMYADDQLTLATKSVVEASSMDYINMLSSMYWMVPTISGLIIGGFSMGALASMTGGITGKVAKGEAVGSEMGVGSWQSGNIMMNNNRSNKQDTLAMYSQGQAYNTQGQAFQATNLATNVGTTSTSNQNVVSGAMQGLSQNMNTLAGGRSDGGNVGANWSANSMTKHNSDGTSYQNGTWTNKGADGSVTEMTGNMTLGANGEILNASGVKYTSKGKNGTTEGEFSYANGELISSKVSNDKGTAVETTRNSDGTYTQKASTKSGASVTNIVDKDGRAINDKDNNGPIDFKMPQIQGSEDFAKSKAIEKATNDEIAKSLGWDNKKAHAIGKDTAISDKTGHGHEHSKQTAFNADGGLGINAGILKAGVSATVTDGDKIGTTKSGDLTITDKDGNTKTYETSDSFKQSHKETLAKKEAEMSSVKFSTNEPMRDLFKSEHDKNKNETAVETLERLDRDVAKTEEQLKSNIVNSKPELANTALNKEVESGLKASNAVTKSKEQIEKEQEKAKTDKDFASAMANFQKTHKIEDAKAREGIMKEAGGALLAGAAAYLGLKKGGDAYKAMKNKIDAKLAGKHGDDFAKSANEINKNIKKMDDALDGKDTKNVKQVFKDMGMLNHAEKNGLVFKGNDLDVEATHARQTALKAEGKLKDFAFNGGNEVKAPSTPNITPPQTPTGNAPKVGDQIVKGSSVSATDQAKNNAGWKGLVNSGTSLKDLPVALSDKGNYGRLTGSFDSKGNPEVAFFPKGGKGTTKSMPWSLVSPAVDNPQAHSIFNKAANANMATPHTPQAQPDVGGGGLVKNVTTMLGLGYVASEADKALGTNIFTNGLKATDLASPLGVVSGVSIGKGQDLSNENKPIGKWADTNGDGINDKFIETKPKSDGGQGRDALDGGSEKSTFQSPSKYIKPSTTTELKSKYMDQKGQINGEFTNNYDKLSEKELKILSNSTKDKNSKEQIDYIIKERSQLHSFQNQKNVGNDALTKVANSDEINSNMHQQPTHGYDVIKNINYDPVAKANDNYNALGKILGEKK